MLKELVQGVVVQASSTAGIYMFVFFIFFNFFCFLLVFFFFVEILIFFNLWVEKLIHRACPLRNLNAQRPVVSQCKGPVAKFLNPQFQKKIKNFTISYIYIHNLQFYNLNLCSQFINVGHLYLFPSRLHGTQGQKASCSDMATLCPSSSR